MVLREDGMLPTKWPLAKVIKVHAGNDGLDVVYVKKWNLYLTCDQDCRLCTF